VRGFALPPLPVARANWAKAVRLSPKWDDSETWTVREE
jgi:hypothetical protein